MVVSFDYFFSDFTRLDGNPSIFSCLTYDLITSSLSLVFSRSKGLIRLPTNKFKRFNSGGLNLSTISKHL